MSSNDAKSSSRLFYIDNIRIYLTVLVILHHVAVAYGGSGGWPLKEAATDTISPIIFLLFNALNQSYFMSFFFILAGYFTPRSLESKGWLSFLKGRLTRLGIPMMIYALLLGPFTSWIVLNIAYNLGVPFSSIWRDAINVGSIANISFGHLWFLQALLIFAVIYVVYWKIYAQNNNGAIIIYQNDFPPNRVLTISIVVLSLVTFLVRVWIPIGVYVFGLQLAHITHYVFSFFVGVLAYRGGWLNNLTRAQARLWGKIALVNLFLLPVIFVLGVGDGVDAFMGGLTWQAFATATWESISMISIIVWLLDFFRYRFNIQNKILQLMAPSVFAAYIFHQILVVLVMIPFLQFIWPTYVKFVLVSIISVPVCFLFSFVIRRIPYLDRVL